jgi:hypothetical protein
MAEGLGSVAPEALLFCKARLKMGFNILVAKFGCVSAILELSAPRERDLGRKTFCKFQSLYRTLRLVGRSSRNTGGMFQLEISELGQPAFCAERAVRTTNAILTPKIS